MGIKVIIIGGVAGGASAAARLRRLDENAQIILLEKGEHISFANCGLPYYIGNVITEKDKLLVQTPEAMKKRFNIDVRVKNEALRIIPGKKEIEIKNLESGEVYSESYDKLVLAPGAEPIRPKLPGIDCDRIFTLRNIPDTYAIKEYVEQMKPESAVVVGAGFIGLEVAENLHARGVKVSVVELASHVIGPLDYDMASIVHQHLKVKGIDLFLEDGVRSFERASSYVDVGLNSSKAIKADMVIMGIGVRPETRLAKEAGLAIGETGGILVDAGMLTSNPDIYAVGDAVEVRDFVNGKPALIPLAGPANKQGRIAADNICGLNQKYVGTQGTSIVKVFDIAVALTGNNEKTLQRNGIDYEKSFTHSGSHAGYYPGAIPMSIKLLFSKTDGKILGAQIIGYEGVDKRIDVIATAMRAGMTVYDLEKLELAYAPPYSSAKDPVNIAGFVAANILKGDSNIFHWDRVEDLKREGAYLLDVRTPLEFTLGSIEGAVNIPLDDLRRRIDEIPSDRDVYAFCQVGQRGYLAARILMQKGFKKVFNLSGGFKTYQLAAGKELKEDIYAHDKISKSDEIKPVDCHGDDCKAAAAIMVDACGLQCPGPILEVYNAIKSMNYGEVLSVKATDPGFQADIKTWCEKTGNKLMSLNFTDKTFVALIRKEKSEAQSQKTAGGNDKTFVVFSNDLDKIIATFIMANGAAAMGRKVTLFFTFWGLNVLRKREKVSVKKDIFARMFGFMMPRGTRKLSLSKMNMGGMGAKMIRFMMRKKNVDSLETLMAKAMANGVEFIACNMSMDIMGIQKEELIDGVKIGGVATFLGSAEDADMSLFI